jgi:thiamine biosynthesis lipoprotein
MQLLERNVSDSGAPGTHMWAVSVSNPDDSAKLYMSTFAKDIGVSTSGTYDFRYSIGGREYSHIIDPGTGEPTRSEVASVTVLGKDAERADALSTALCTMDKTRARDFMDKTLKGYRVAMVVRGENGFELVTNMAPGDYSAEE